MTTALIVCAHGTDNLAGQGVVRSITSQVRELLPEVTVRDAYVDVQDPGLPAVVEELVAQHDAVVIVPLLLSSGFHTEVDVAQAARAHANVVAAPALGPHGLLADVLRDRLLAAGADPVEPVVLAVAGSSRAAGATDAEAMVGLLHERWGADVTVGYLSAREPSVVDAVARAGQRAAIASYLVGPGFFHDRLRRVGARIVGEPLGDDPRMAQLVVQRFLDAVQPAAPR